MKKIRNHLFLQTIAGCLTLAFLMPNSAYALRPMGVDNTGLEEKIVKSLSGDPFREVYPRVMQDLEEMRNRRRQRREIDVPSTILVTGDMGAGKTTFTFGDPGAGIVGLQKFLELKGFHVVVIDDEIFLKDRADRQGSRALLGVDDPDLDRAFFDHLFEPSVFVSVFRKIGEFIRSKELVLSLSIENPYDRQTGTRGRPIPLEITRDSVVLFAGVLMEYWPKDIQFDMTLSLDYDINEDAEVLGRLEAREDRKPSERRLDRDVLGGRVSGPELAAYRLYKQKHSFDGNYVIDNRDMKNPVLYELKSVTAGLEERAQVLAPDRLQVLRQHVERKVHQLLENAGGADLVEAYGGGIQLTSQNELVGIDKWMDASRRPYAVRNGSLFFLDRSSEETKKWVRDLKEDLGPNFLWVERLGESELGLPDLAPYTHTTVAAMRRVDLEGKLVIESGAGQGIPAMAALREGGASFVILLESSPASADLARLNLERNGYRSGGDGDFQVIEEDIQDHGRIEAEIQALRRPEREAVLISNVGGQGVYVVSNFESIELIPVIERATQARLVAVVGAGEKISADLQSRSMLERDQDFLERRFRFTIDPDEIHWTAQYNSNVSAVAWIARRPPAAGLEEDAVKFVYDPSDFPDGRLNANRQGFAGIGLGNWIPPLTAWEAAALNAFVYGRLEREHSQLHPLSQVVEGDGRSRSPRIGKFRVILHRDEAAAYLDRLYDLQVAVGGFDPKKIKALGLLWFGADIRASVLQREQQLHEPWPRRSAQQEIEFWRNSFRSVLKKTLALRSEEDPFAVVSSRRVGEVYYQEVPPGGQVAIPWKAAGKGIRIRIDGAEFNLKAVRPETEGTSLWPWKLEGRRFPVVRREPDGTYSLTAQIVENHSHSVPLSGPVRFSALPQEVVAQVGARKLLFRGKEELILYILRLGRQELPVLVERPVEHLARDLMPREDREVEALRHPPPSLRPLPPDGALLLALEIVEQVVDRGRPFNRWIDLGRFLSETLGNPGGEGSVLDTDTGGRAVIIRMAQILERPYPDGGPISDYERVDTGRRDSLIPLLEIFRKEHQARNPSEYLNELLEKKRGGSEQKNAGLEERVMWPDLPVPVPLEVGAARYTDDELKNARRMELSDY